MTPDSLTILFNFFNAATAVYFYRDQKNLFEEHTQKGGEKAGVGIPLLIALPITFSLFVIAVTYILYFSI